MRIGIDASNLRSGGGITHLVEVLRVAEPSPDNFREIVIWGPTNTLKRIEPRPWLNRVHESILDRGLASRLMWQRHSLGHAAHKAKCDVLFAPGGLVTCSFTPTVTMCRTMLPFDPPEMARYGWSLTGLRLLALRRAQTKSFRAAAGVIFLTEYARRQVLSAIGAVRGRTAVIPHGVSSVFSQLPRQARQRYTDEAPFQLAYTSIVDLYKHQWMVVDAISMLRSKGIPISLILAGPAYKPALRRLRKAMSEAPSEPGIVKYIGAATTAELTAIYSAADSFAFASSCENMPNILLEGMASGLPIMCSNRSSMPEVLGDCGIYFDPESASSIADAARQLFESPQLRARLSQASYERSKLFSWNRCARETFRFISDVVAKTES